jgi:hypothetical protein
MATEVRKHPQNKVKIVTRDKYGNTNHYTFGRNQPGEPYEPVGDYTWTAVEALADEGIIVAFDFNDLRVDAEGVFDLDRQD